MEIDVTDKVYFSTDIDEDYKERFYFHCVCGDKFDYPIDGYTAKDRLLFDCPKCGAKIYFADTETKGRSKIIQVINE